MFRIETAEKMVKIAGISAKEVVSEPIFAATLEGRSQRDQQIT